MFRAYMISKTETGQRVQLGEFDEATLPEGDVLLAPEWSTLNYKDALALSGRGPIVRKWPMIPGIDGAGTVIESRHPDWKANDRFVINGWGIGEAHWGCYAERARVQGDWLVHPPEVLSTRQTMAVGTAGYTAMLSVLAMEAHGVKTGPVLVTGATGGVGSIAVALLAQLGYEVTAVTGKDTEHPFLRALGASTILSRKEFTEPGKPLQKERWAAVVDVAGGHTLANACAQTRTGGIVAACGLAESSAIEVTVMPFILRGVNLQGINSATAPLALRRTAWQRLATDLNLSLLDSLTSEVDFSRLVATSGALLDGKTRGRIVTRVSGPS